MKLPYGLDRSEASNMLQWACNPVHAWFLVTHAFKVVLHSLALRLLPVQWWYPYRVRMAVRLLPQHAPAPVGPVTEAQPVPPGPLRLRLACGYLHFESDPEWKTSFDDSEQYVSLHRWNWLLHALADEDKPASFQWGVHLMRSWLRALGAVPAGLASESYTLGERIANALLFARLAGGGWRCLPGDVVQNLLRMAVVLSRQLEYHGETATGNHPFNNARALYLAGKCLDIPQLEQLAKTIIDERLRHLLDAEGFMREGSSHYHLLFTRWLLELKFAANEFEDTPMLDLLESPVRRALQRSIFFLIQCGREDWQLPLVGDVSPDCSPAWLIDLPRSALVRHDQYGIKPITRPLRGWARLWSLQNGGLFAESQKCPSQFVEAEQLFQSFAEAGWYRLDWNGWTAIWHAQAGGSVAEAAHAHQDFASFVLYHCGREILIDIGRPNYERSSAIGNYAMTPLAHNSITLEGLGPMLTSRDRFLPPRYRKGQVSLHATFDGKRAVVDLTHDGWVRLAGRHVKHTRRFCFLPDKIDITDLLDGDGEVRVGMAFHWPGAPGLPGSRFSVERDVNGVHIIKDEIECGVLDSIRGWRFPTYGEHLPCASQLIQATAYLPATIRHRITIKE